MNTENDTKQYYGSGRHPNLAKPSFLDLDVNQNLQDLVSGQFYLLKIDKDYFFMKYTSKTVNVNKNVFKKGSKIDDLTKMTMDPSVLKYYKNRYYLFSKFDQGIKIDDTGLFSVTPEAIAKHTASRLRYEKILDVFAGVGGNSIQFALKGSQVTCIEIDKNRVEMLEANAKVYNCDQKIETICQDFLKLDLLEKNNVDDNLEDQNANPETNLEEYQYDCAFLSPPWGGVDYIKQGLEYSIFTHLTPNIVLTLDKAATLAPRICFMMPRNTRISELVTLFTTLFTKIEVEENTNKLNNFSPIFELEEICKNGRLSVKNVYFGEFYHGTEDLNDNTGDDIQQQKPDQSECFGIVGIIVDLILKEFILKKETITIPKMRLSRVLNEINVGDLAHVFTKALKIQAEGLALHEIFEEEYQLLSLVIVLLRRVLTVEFYEDQQGWEGHHKLFRSDYNRENFIVDELIQILGFLRDQNSINMKRGINNEDKKGEEGIWNFIEIRKEDLCQKNQDMEQEQQQQEEKQWPQKQVEINNEQLPPKEIPIQKIILQPEIPTQKKSDPIIKKSHQHRNRKIVDYMDITNPISKPAAPNMKRKRSAIHKKLKNQKQKLKSEKMRLLKIIEEKMNLQCFNPSTTFQNSQIINIKILKNEPKK